MPTLLYRLGHLAARRPLVTIGAWLIAAVTVVALSVSFGRELEDSTAVPGLDSQIAVDLLSAASSESAGPTAQIVVSPADPVVLAEVEAEVEAEAGRLQRVLATSTTRANGVALVRLQYPVLEEVDAGDLDALKDVVRDLDERHDAQIEAGGDLFFAFEQPESGIAELIGLVAAVVILLVAFGSVVAMGLPIGMALFGLGVGIASMSLVTYVVEIPSFATTLASMVGLGVGIDYALFIVTRHREQLAAGMSVVDAAATAVATAGQSVLFAGGTVVVSILGLAVAGLPFLTAAGVAISMVVLLMVLASITLLPAFLGLAGPWIDRLTLRRGRGHRGSTGSIGARWQRWGTHVAAHAWPYAVGVTAVLLALSAPVLALRLGIPDEGSLPESRTERRAYDLVADGFGPGANGPLVVAVDLRGDLDAPDALAAAIAADAGVASVQEPVVDVDGGVAVIVAVPTDAPQDEATLETIDRLRSEVFPEVLANSSASAHVGGGTANFADLGQRVGERLPWFVAAVILLSFVLLTMVFRSIVVPVKAALLNLLSIGASYGVLVMVFQWEWGGSLIGLEGSVPIVSFIPMLMFAVVFGLSMDYEVFLLSRVREHFLRTGDDHAAVVHGLASTARVITSAALIMVSVFLGFVLGDDPTVKMLGLGLATAIFVDATVVRMVLVPATMTLAGRANWWLPGWLDRLLPRIDVDAGSPDPAGQAETKESSEFATTS